MDLEILGQYLEALEDKHKKVIRFFAQVMQNPGSFMDLIVQQYQNDNNLNNSDNNLVSPRQLRFNANKRIRSIDDINHEFHALQSHCLSKFAWYQSEAYIHLDH